MSGEIHRLKSWTGYRPKLAHGEEGMVRESYKTPAGYHTVVVILGAVAEGESVKEEWVAERMRELGWVREK